MLFHLDTLVWFWDDQSSSYSLLLWFEDFVITEIFTLIPLYIPKFQNCIVSLPYTHFAPDNFVSSLMWLELFKEVTRINWLSSTNPSCQCVSWIIFECKDCEYAVVNFRVVKSIFIVSYVFLLYYRLKQIKLWQTGTCYFSTWSWMTKTKQLMCA